MSIFLRIILAVVTLGIAGSTIHFVYMALVHPRLFVAWQTECSYWPFWKRAVYITALFAGMFGIGFMLYHGALGAMWWVPKSWRDDEGDPVVYTLAFTFAAFGLAGLLTGSKKILDEIISRPQK